MVDIERRPSLPHRLRRRARFEAGRASERISRPLVGGRPPSSAVLLVGSGRSGTTWIADAIVAAGRLQQIFEPLQPNAVPEARRVAGWEDGPWTLVRSRYLGPGRPHPAWNNFLDRVFRGDVRNYWTDQVRTSWFPKRYLIKMIRANLMLGFIDKAFRPPIVLVVRHPCAVVASRLRIPWQANVDDILSQEQLVEEHLRPWVGKIERERDPVGAHAVWWAVENYIASKDLEEIPHHRLHFEHACLEPASKVGELCSWLRIEGRPSRRALSEASRMTLGGSESTRARLEAWKSQLDAESQRRILTWAEAFGLTWYTEEALPREEPS